MSFKLNPREFVPTVYDSALEYIEKHEHKASADDTVPAVTYGITEIDPNYYNSYSMAAARQYVGDYLNHRGGRRARNRKLSRRRRQSKRQRRSRKSRK
jgi:hypothetical protein